ncbi:SIMPL domain-containing protein [Branchiibius sp. NY16-3462-2]|uniref:SIMPL domain-containing protein n=1 Tax=Branchiibius sp. NY16-3462-2 TaxID=1807500 RepID=UPI000797D3AD|nr:SIMPL domain-containing protein [Branchiibius sp. NY16-3462-2]KYH43153.1 hypothetical protein AZH51_17815 [Branchiibius sp. NY16-3462-2]
MTTEAATLRVTGTATSGATPDRVELRLGVEHSASSAPAALDAAAAAAHRLVAAIKAADVADHDVQTAGLSLDRGWDPEKNVPSGYVARHRFAVRTALDASGEVIAAAADAAGDDLRVESVSLAVSDTDPLRTRAQRDAFDDARTQATELARRAGRQLGPVLAIDTSPANGPIPLQPKAMRMMSADAGGPMIEGGEFTVTATIVVVYQLT